MNKAEAISNAVMSTKLNQGRREGIKEGRELEKIDFVRAMLEDGLPLEMISKYSKLSIERLGNYTVRMINSDKSDSKNQTIQSKNSISEDHGNVKRAPY